MLQPQGFFSLTVSRLLYFISHPNVAIDEHAPIPSWPLSALGRARMAAGLRQPWVRGLTSVYCSAEQKAIDGAAILAEHLGLAFQQVESLGEIDRSSTGYLPPPEFEAMADRFFAEPDDSVRGWERAVDAQARIVSAAQSVAFDDRTPGAIAIVSHGAVGALLYSWLTRQPISRRWDQPANGGGNFYAFVLDPPAAHGCWQALDGPVT